MGASNTEPLVGVVHVSDGPEFTTTPRSDDPQDVAAAKLAEVVLRSPHMQRVLQKAMQRHVVQPILSHVLYGDPLPPHLEADPDVEVLGDIHEALSAARSLEKPDPAPTLPDPPNTSRRAAKPRQRDSR